MSTFGVTWQMVQAMHGGADYSDISTTIEGWIEEGGAEASTIVQEAPGVDATDVPQDEPIYKHCQSYVKAYAARLLVQRATRQDPDLAKAYAEDMKRLDKLIRAHTVGAMGDSFDRKEHLGTFRGGRASGGGGGGGGVRGAYNWSRKTRM